ncbi:NADPH-dependent FMN reductase [Intrasporangium sp. YIM S08009]|uniref:NADPH-dependent FMN reductase n=1 Tax=Intrasporangium zincisolvens TaxID=3080018 RepID=UPI002B05CE1D|nr:NADPH-dependent FMN reductase [Intrasporangium sp. YIM S08009]
MASIVTLSGSPSAPSRTEAVLGHVERRLQVRGHDVTRVVVRDLPAGALLHADATHPEVAAVVAAIAAADGVVVTTPVYKAAYTGLLKALLDLLPQYALRGKTVLPVATGGSPAHVLAVDYALRPVLVSLGAEHVTQGWFVLAGDVHVYPSDGGVLLSEGSGRALHQVTESFLAQLARSRPHLSPAPAAGPDDDVVLRVSPRDDVAAPLLEDLVVEYGTRYGRTTAETQLTEVPVDDFESPDGAFLVVVRDGQTIAGGAIRRYDAETAEVKRVWTNAQFRRQGLARRVLSELEGAAASLGYRRIHLTTGPRQPEARALYLAAGYVPAFDTSVDPEAVGPHAFDKELPTSGVAAPAPWAAGRAPEQPAGRVDAWGAA